jgi:hypothetical protein
MANLLQEQGFWVLPGPKKPLLVEWHPNSTVRPAKRWSVVRQLQ